MRRICWIAITALLAALSVWPTRAAEVALEWPIDAGTTGVLVEDHRAPLAHVRIEFGAGAWMPWFRDNDVEEAFTIQDHDSAGQLRLRADLLAARITLGVGRRTSLLTLDCHTEVLPQALELVGDILANRDFDRATLKRWQRSRTIGWKASLKDPSFVLRQAGARQLFGTNDPRRFAVEAPEPLNTDVDRLVRARERLVRLPGRVVGFAGAITRDEAKRLAADLLPVVDPLLPPGLGALPLVPISPERRPREVEVKLPRLTQTYLGHGRMSLATDDLDYPASMIADHVLGGHFNSRLMVALRQEGGETYGAAVRNEGSDVPGLYALATFTRTENGSAIEEKLRGVLREFCADGITEAERAAAASNALGRRAFARQSPAQLLASYLRDKRLNLPQGFDDQLAEKAAALSLDEVNAFIKRFHSPNGFMTVRVVRR